MKSKSQKVPLTMHSPCTALLIKFPRLGANILQSISGFWGAMITL